MLNLKNLKIDMVYTWVDNNDVEWKRKKNKYMAECDDLFVNADCRYINNDELKYSLRSLERYANWIDKIYIITDNQVPEWLNLNNKRIKIINHSEIMPKDSLPVFNSNAIEHCISNIQELSEYYLYGNDDMFFANYVKPSFFYHRDGYPYCRFGSKYDTTADTYSQMCDNSASLVEKEFGESLRMFSHHNINAFRKSDVKNCISMFKNEINNTIYSRFRKANNVEQTIYLNYALAVKHGHYKGICRLYKYMPIYKNKIYSYCAKRYRSDSLYIRLNDANSLKRLGSLYKKVRLFCINDVENISDKERIFAKKFLQEIFPQKSSFEK